MGLSPNSSKKYCGNCKKELENLKMCDICNNREQVVEFNVEEQLQFVLKKNWQSIQKYRGIFIILLIIKI